MNVNPKIVIISAEKENQDNAKNNAATERLRKAISRTHYTNGRFSGFSKIKFYKGDKFEYAYLVVLKDDNYEEELQMLKSCAYHNFDQDAIIFSDANRHTELILKDGSTESMGKLTGVEKEIAELDYRYFQHNDNYYITKLVH